MSAHASFYLAKQDYIPLLSGLAKCTLTLGQWMSLEDSLNLHADTVKDFETNFPFEYAYELEAYNWSGYIMADLHAFLASHSLHLDDYIDKEISDYLAEAQEGLVLVFRHEGARQLTDAIKAVRLDTTTSLDFVRNRFQTEHREVLHAFQDAVSIMQVWLAQVDREHMGILVVR